MYIWGNLKSGKILILPHVKYRFQNAKSLQYQKKKKLKPSNKDPEIKLKMNNFTGHQLFLRFFRYRNVTIYFKPVSQEIKTP